MATSRLHSQMVIHTWHSLLHSQIVTHGIFLPTDSDSVTWPPSAYTVRFLYKDTSRLQGNQITIHGHLLITQLDSISFLFSKILIRIFRLHGQITICCQFPPTEPVFYFPPRQHYMVISSLHRQVVTRGHFPPTAYI